MAAHENFNREPNVPRTRLSAEELVEAHRLLPRVDYAAMRDEADAFFGSEDRVGADPSSR